MKKKATYLDLLFERFLTNRDDLVWITEEGRVIQIKLLNGKQLDDIINKLEKENDYDLYLEGLGG